MHFSMFRLLCPQRCFASMMLILILTGCSISPPVKLYNLQPITLKAGEMAADKKNLGIGPLDFPEYLKRSLIVIRNTDNQLSMQEFHRWAEPLDIATPKIIAANISELSADIFAVGNTYSDKMLPLDYRLAGRVIRFDTDEAGQVKLSIQWWVQDLHGQMLLPRYTQIYTAQADNPQDMDSVVVAMSETLQQLSVDIVEKLNSLP
jgi:uncharacterized lipoprotein YmbA